MAWGISSAAIYLLSSMTGWMAVKSQPVSFGSKFEKGLVASRLIVLCFGGSLGSLTRFRYGNKSQAAFLDLREGQRWPVEHPMEGWLDWHGWFLPAVPVEIANFGAGGVAVLVRQQLELSPGGHGVFCSPRPMDAVVDTSQLGAAGSAVEPIVPWRGWPSSAEQCFQF
jgi:hypothetical protein